MKTTNRFEFDGSALAERFGALPGRGIEDGLVLERGCIGDFDRLHGHHYRAGRPGTATRVWVLRHREAGVCERYRGGGEKYRVVGVLVESLPSLNCRMRDWALGGRYAGLGGAKVVGPVLKREVRCISRVVVHPQWRGLGLAVRLVRASLADAETDFTEALAAMGKVHPFFEKAGMAAYHRPAHVFDRRLIEVFERVGIGLVELADARGVYRRVCEMDAGTCAWVLGELTRWSRCTYRRALSDPVAQLMAARGRVMCEPVYYLKDNRVEVEGR